MKAALKYVGKSRYTLEDLKEIITILRAPDGCPWDREQDHKSIRRDFLEECYEAIEAIDTEDPVLLREELGFFRWRSTVSSSVKPVGSTWTM